MTVLHSKAARTLLIHIVTIEFSHFDMRHMLINRENRNEKANKFVQNELQQQRLGQRLLAHEVSHG
jgi:Mn-containing catalase